MTKWILAMAIFGIQAQSIAASGAAFICGHHEKLYLVVDYLMTEAFLSNKGKLLENGQMTCRRDLAGVVPFLTCEGSSNAESFYRVLFDRPVAQPDVYATILQVDSGIETTLATLRCFQPDEEFPISQK